MADGVLQVNVASVVEDALQHHLGNRMLTDVDLASRKSEQASLRRYEAAGWLRKMVGVVGGKDLPAQPSEDEFRLGLQSGITLCNVLNKVQAGSVPKVVEAASDTVVISDGAALSAYQYFENVRNFLVAVEDMGIPAFETSDLEQGGKSLRIVNSVLALKSYYDWKQGGGNGVCRFGGNRKPPCADEQFVRRDSEVARAVTAPDDSEELDAGTSDSSEVDYRCQLNVLHSNNAANVLVAPKTRIPSPKPRGGSETRSLIPQPTTRKVLNGIQSPLQRPRRQSSFDGKRKPACGK